MPKQLVTAPLAVIDAVIAEAVVPCLRQLEAERGQPVPVIVTQWLTEAVGPSVLVGAAPGADGLPPPAGELRLMFRKNYGGDRFLFRAQAVYPEGFTPHKGFAGFIVQGGVDVSDDRPTRLHYDGWSVTWNDRGFSRWA